MAESEVRIFKSSHFREWALSLLGPECVVLFLICFTDAPADGEGGLEDENRSVSGFLHFDTATKGKVFWICNKLVHVYVLNGWKFQEVIHFCICKFWTDVEKLYKELSLKKNFLK